MYTKNTHDVVVIASTNYLDEHSTPEAHRYVWAYDIQIENRSNRTLQLLNRYWHITDGLGQVQEVRGPGVVGEQPVLKPGEAFRYTSGAALTTPSGIMVGSYQMIDKDQGTLLDVAIPAFSLDSPFDTKRPS